MPRACGSPSRPGSTSPLSQGTGGGVSSLFDRPAWQRAVMPRPGPDTPADARCGRRRRPVHRREDRLQPAAGTGSAVAPRSRRPIWAGLAAVMNQYLLATAGSARRPQPAAVPRRRRRAAARVPRRHRSAGTPSTTPGPATTWSPVSARPMSTTWSRNLLDPPEGEPMTTDPQRSRQRGTQMTRDDAECRVCETDVPAGEYCGLCGCHLTAPARGRPGLAAHAALTGPRRRASAAAVGGRARCSRTCRRVSRTVFRVGLAVVLARWSCSRCCGCRPR